MKGKAKVELCGDQFDKGICRKEKGHWGKHQDGGHTWTDGGKKRVLQEQEKLAEIEAELKANGI
jgi:hypothetical protein